MTAYVIPAYFVAGQFLYEEVCKLPDHEVAFVWNRTADIMKGEVPEHLILQDLSQFASRFIVYKSSANVKSTHSHLYLFGRIFPSM